MARKKISANNEEALIFPLFAMEKIVLTPMLPQPLKIESEEQKTYLDNCIKAKTQVFIATSKEASNGQPREEDILKTGIVCEIDRILQMPGAPSLAFVRPLFRATLQGLVYAPSYPMARVVPLPDIMAPRRKSAETKLMIEHVEKLFHGLLNYAGEQEKEAAHKLIGENSLDQVQHLYALSHVSPISWEDKYMIVEANTFDTLLQSLALAFDDTEQKFQIQASIQEKVHRELTQQQKESFLRVHLKQIKEELGETEENDEISDLLIKSNEKKWPEAARQHFDKELQKLRRLNINNPEYSVQYAYLETLLDLPWENYNHKKISLDKVEEILNRDHYGLEKVKERILEYMAVMKLRNDLKAPILCLYGPPGVGKTSIGKSVAEAVGREYARISLGGMHDEAEIRGHRRTYIGAMPGRFLHALSKCKYGNPLILLDEIDKVGKDFKGDPSSALLEALDPEQNNTFHDNFIDYPYDLSKVLFIATANDINAIPDPLRDRLEIIEMARYSHEEKREIAFRHLIDQALTDNGFKPKEVVFTPEAIDTIIRLFTKEAGVRQLKMQISKIIRKLALMKVKGKKLPEEITGKLVAQLLDKKDSQFNRLGFQG